MHTLIVISGPTGVGKTEICLKLAKHFSTSIINADSRQIYREIPIGTAAPTEKQLSAVKHYLVGERSLHDYYSAALFEQEVLNIIKKESDSGGQHFSLLSGGSMMYIDAVCNGIDDIPTVDNNTRQLLKEKLENEGLESLVEELRQKDYNHWLNVDRKNPRRVVHALEICYMTGKPYSSFLKNEKKKRPFNIIKIGINTSREELYSRINSRVITMLESGFEKEARSVYHLKGINSLNTVGYKELFDFFDGNTTKEEAVLKIQSNTRQYARKQLTWLKNDSSFTWFYPNNLEELIKYIEKTSSVLQQQI